MPGGSDSPSSAGRPSVVFAAAASSPHDKALAGTPATPRRPSSVSTMSSTFASSRWAASWRAFASTPSLAFHSALPPICSEREPMVPVPRGTSAVSDCTMVTRSIGMPRSSWTIIANDVS